MKKSLEQVLGEIKPLSTGFMDKARKRQDDLTKPQGSLGRFEEVSIQLAGIKKEFPPRIEKKAIIVMAADHGVVSEGVSAYPQEVTAQMVYNFLRGGAGINVFSGLVESRVVVVDMGVMALSDPPPELYSRKVASGTRNMMIGPAMTVDEAKTAVETGIEVVEKEISKGLDIVGTGDMGIGNTTASSAICAAVTGEPVDRVTGRGTGIDEKGLEHKIGVIQRALAVNKPDSKDALDVLSKVGGFEIGGLAGVMLGAAAHRVPVVIDGFISGAAALIASTLSPRLVDYLIASHVSVEVGHKVVLKYLGLNPLLDLEMRLGEGTGSAIGIFMAEAASRILSDMATFGEAAVSGKEIKD